MRRWQKLVLAIALPIGLAAAWASVALTGTHESVACATASATTPGVTTPDHVVGIDGVPLYTFKGLNFAGTSDVQTGCVTATATDSSTPGPTVTVTTTVPPPPQFLFADEFNGAAGAPPDPNKWRVYGGTSPPRFGVECFVNDASHVAQDGNGNLKLTATYNPGGVPCTNGSGLYESGGIHTADESQTCSASEPNCKYKYGLAEARIKVPCQSGTGLWPAWWESGVAPSKPWPTDGEIDTMEIGSGGGPNDAQQGLHGPVTATTGHWHVGFDNIASSPWCGDYHVYANDWRNGKITFLIDGVVVHTETAAQVQAAGNFWPFDAAGELQQMILTLQMGANGGTINNSTLPQSMLIDWVHLSP